MKEREQAEKLLEYQNLRGGRILLQTIAVSTACSRPPKNSSFLGFFLYPSVVYFFGFVFFYVSETDSGGLERWSGCNVLFSGLPEVSEHVHSRCAPQSRQPHRPPCKSVSAR